MEDLAEYRFLAELEKCHEIQSYIKSMSKADFDIFSTFDKKRTK